MNNEYSHKYQTLLSSIKSDYDITSTVKELDQTIDSILKGELNKEEEYFFISKVIDRSIKLIWNNGSMEEESIFHANRYFQKALRLFVEKIDSNNKKINKIFTRIFSLSDKNNNKSSFYNNKPNKEVYFDLDHEPIFEPYFTRKTFLSYKKSYFEEEKEEEKEKEKKKEKESHIFIIRKFSKTMADALIENSIKNTTARKVINYENYLFGSDWGFENCVEDGYNHYFLKNVDFFGRIGGFRILFQYLLSPNHQISLNTTYNLIMPFTVINKYCIPRYLNSFLKIVPAIFDRILNLKYEILKTFPKKKLKKFLDYLIKLLSLTEEKDWEIISEEFYLDYTFKLFYSPYLDMRYSSMRRINKIIKSLEYGTANYSYQYGQTSYSKNKFKYLSKDILFSWIENTGIIKDVFGVSMHAQIIGASGNILTFLSQNNQISTGLIDAIFDSTIGIHTSLSDAIFDIIGKISENLNLELSNYIFERKLKSITKWDTPNIKFLHNFTEGTLERTMEPFNFFMSLINSTKINYSTRVQLKEYMEKLFKSKNFGTKIKKKTIRNLITFLTAHKDLTISLPLLITLIKTYSEQSYYMQTTIKLSSTYISQGQVVQLLENEYKIIDEIINDITLIQNKIKGIVQKGNLDIKNPPTNLNKNSSNKKHKNKTINRSQKKKKNVNEGQEDDETKLKWVDYHFFDSFSYLEHLNTRLTFLESFTKFSSNVKINKKQIKRLWTLFVDERLFEGETDRFYEWITTIENEDKVNAFLFNKIQSLKPEDYTVSSFKIFQHFGFHANKNKNNLSGKLEDFEISEMDINELIGLEPLWNIFLKAKNKQVQELSMKFLLQFQNLSSMYVSSYGSQKRKEFLKTCFEHLNKNININNNNNNNTNNDNMNNIHNEETIILVFDLIIQFIESIEKNLMDDHLNFERHASLAKKFPIQIKFTKYMNTSNMGYQKKNLKLISMQMIQF
ncbi:hypothetical protein M0813_25190 [Anaeramoeba flamelloides]|uniref:UBP34/UBP24/USP9X/USP9Y-like ARM repeat region domain-containing protein n=1 Tax=Anaeramoeba flamelloides TaxID=1746091 RepID=A0ABQ8Y3A4_9EUKA|nr:hypothetical protein M0813_25190 [Anaeramoeba flamelloides]